MFDGEVFGSSFLLSRESILIDKTGTRLYLSVTRYTRYAEILRFHSVRKLSAVTGVIIADAAYEFFFTRFLEFPRHGGRLEDEIIAWNRRCENELFTFAEFQSEIIGTPWF